MGDRKIADEEEKHFSYITCQLTDEERVMDVENHLEIIPVTIHSSKKQVSAKPK